jgi:hypothetical protein
MAMFLSPEDMTDAISYQRLYQPHTGKATVSRTGTLPPPSCGKGPKVAGESVMVLPGSPRNPASPQDRIARVKAQLRSWEGQRQEGRLTGKGSERESWETAARVVRGWESQLQGETAIRSLEMTLASGMRG